MMCAMVIGSIVSASVVGGSSYSIFFIFNLCSEGLSAITLLVLTEPEK
jgi:hypothetical protein